MIRSNRFYRFFSRKYSVINNLIISITRILENDGSNIMGYNTGWLEPLMDRIGRDATTVVCPVIDVISDDTMEYHHRDAAGVNVGGFDWNLQVCAALLLVSFTCFK